MEAITLTGTDGSVLDIFQKTTPLEVRILERSQIIHEAKMADYAKKTFASISVRFSSAIEGVGKTGSVLKATLPTPTASLSQTITIEAAKTQRLNIRVQWKNTIRRDETLDPPVEIMNPPTFSLELTSSKS